MRKNRDTHFIQNLFDTSTFLKHRRNPLRTFLVLWDENFSTKNHDLSLLSSKIFNTRNLWKTKALHSEKFRYPETKKIYKVVVLLAYKQFLIPERFWNTEVFSYDSFWYCETKNFQQKIMIYPSYAQKYSITEISEKLNGCLAKIFGTLRQKSSTKSWYS